MDVTMPEIATELHQPLSLLIAQRRTLGRNHGGDLAL
jgi:hypothetical protein